MKKYILFMLFISGWHGAFAQAGPCNPTLVGTNTTVISSTMLMDSASSSSSNGILLVCAGNTLTYNAYLGKDFYVQGGATLILKSAQIAKIHLESGATLVFDTIGQVFPHTIINGLTYDSTNVTLIDTQQINIGSASWSQMHCLGHTFNYTAFAPAQPCTPLIIDYSARAVLDATFTNPVNESIQFHTLLENKLSSVRIADLSGKTIRTFNSIQERMDVSFLPQGIYLIQIKVKNGDTVVKKFVKN